MAEGTPDTLAGRDAMLARIRFRLPPGAPAVPDVRSGRGSRTGRSCCVPRTPTTAAARADGMGARPRASRSRCSRSRCRASRTSTSRSPVATRASAVSVAVHVLRQVRFTNKAFWRNPASAFFTFAFPLMFLVIFTSLLGRQRHHAARAPTSRTSTVLRRRDGGLRRDLGLLHEHRDHHRVQSRQGHPEAAAGHAAAAGRLPVGARAARDGRRRRSWSSSPWRSARSSTTRRSRAAMAAVQFLLTFLVGSLSFAALALALTAVDPERRRRARPS